jgi:hypothetical protein
MKRADSVMWMFALDKCLPIPQRTVNSSPNALAAIQAAHTALHTFPVHDGIRVALQVGLPACEFCYLPVVNWHISGVRSQVIPQIL